MGQARGKVGSIVLARSKGQQIARAYNEKPKNPRTNMQMAQRSVFMSAVNFYTHGKQAFFQFAFENKGAKLSDYNAFMSENAKLGNRMTRDQYNQSTYPSIAPWLMTKGTLGELTPELNASESAFELPLAGLATTATIGDVSAAIIAAYGYQIGDIITLTVITANGSNAENTPDLHPEKRGLIEWNLKQFVLDTASTATIADTLGSIVTAEAGKLVITPAEMASDAIGVAMTVSRQTADGLKVSNTYLQLNPAAQTIYENCHTASYIGQVLADWGASGEAILQGSLVQ